MDRRTFLKASAVSAAAAAAGIAAERVSRVYDYKGSDAYTVVKRLVKENSLLNGVIRSGSRVLIKPNMSFSNRPEEGTTTHPGVVKAVAEMCLDAGAKTIVIFDNVLRNEKLCRKNTGIEDAVSGMSGVHILITDRKSDFRDVKVERAKALTETEVCQEFFKADAFINLPTAKSHSAADVSLGMKNLMGVLRRRKRFHFEFSSLNDAIADLPLAAAPALTIIDCKYVLLDGGPAGPGKVQKADRYTASKDIAAVDAYTAELFRWNGRKRSASEIRHIAAAGEAGIGNIDTKKMEIIHGT
ncbi:MAG: DUF362 domain-containing protein [Fibrobacterota bacterium]